MNKPFIKRWIKALRSGKYKQGYGTLHNIDLDTGEEYFCCLGVAANISRKCERSTDDGIVSYRYKGVTVWDSSYLSDRFLKWIGISKPDQDQLTKYNDVAGLTFTQIAQRLEDALIKGKVDLS